MADLYHLEDEILEQDLQHQEEVLNGNEEGGEEWAADDDREELDVPAELQKAARRKLNEASTVEEEDDEDQVGDLDDLFSGAAAENQQNLQDLQYTKLFSAWSQEMSSPELLPFPEETFNEMAAAIEDAENDEEDGTLINTGNANMDALFQSILRIDSERVKFLLADILKLRLQKIQAHPLHMRTMTERMSDNEVAFLKEYGQAVEHHLRTTVTDHFPQDVWKQLDAPDMIDEPDLDAFVFLKCLQDITIGDDDDDETADGDRPKAATQNHNAGTCLIVRYKRIRDLHLQGKVELM